MTKPMQQNLMMDIRANLAKLPIAKNNFDRDESWINLIVMLVFIVCGVVSGFATFTGIRLFLTEVGDVGFLANGTSVLLTIAVSSILTVGWSLMYAYGAEARNGLLKGGMMGLAALLLAMTFAVSSLSNLMALVGPAAKIYDWKQSLTTSTVVVNTYGNRSLAISKLKPGWEAAQAQACQLANAEETRGAVSTAGRGVGPVSVALTTICAQTTAFIAAMDEAVVTTEAEIGTARAALHDMRVAIRDRDRAVIEREDDFLDAGEVLNGSLQTIQAADLTGVLDAGAAQVAGSISELRADSSFSSQQVEMVSSIKESLGGLVDGTTLISERLAAEPLPDYAPVTSVDFIDAIVRYANRFIPVFAAAIAIDAFQIWALMFVLCSKAGKTPARLRGQFDRLIESDTLSPLALLEPQDQPKRRRFPWFRRKTGLS